jgi:hypothetical protein
MEGSKVARYGMWATVAYVSSTLVYVACEWEHLLDMKPNEFGDFLAGTVGPLAFLWLVAGFYLQREGLAQNSRALQMQTEELALQVKELRNSVEQQSRLAAIAEQDLLLRNATEERERLERDATFAPSFQVESAGNVPGRPFAYFKVINTGADVTYLGISGIGIRMALHGKIESNIWTTGLRRNVTIANSALPEAEIGFEIHYVRGDNRKQTMRFVWSDPENVVEAQPIISVEDT